MSGRGRPSECTVSYLSHHCRILASAGGASVTLGVPTVASSLLLVAPWVGPGAS